MKNIKGNIRYIYAVLVAASVMLLSAGCEKEEVAVEETMPLVVEGWIEEGSAPVVMVTRAVDLTQDVSGFDDKVEKWCRVSVYDDDVRYVLTGRVNDAYMPRFVFTHTRLKGRRGHSYRLVVETDDSLRQSYYQSEAVIEPAPAIERKECVAEEGDSLFRIKVYLKDLDEGGYYKAYSMTLGLEQRYYPTFLGTFSGREYDAANGLDITRGVASVSNIEDSREEDESGTDSVSTSHFFKRGETVKIKICRISRENYEFWKVYDSNVSLGNNLFFTFAENCPSNIAGALGYWGAWGVAETAVAVRPAAGLK